MLDFGTKMPSGGNDKDVENNDLFSTLKEEKSSSAAEKFDTAKPLVFDNIPASGAEKIQRVPMPGSKSAASGRSLLSRKRGDNLLNDKQEVSRIIRAARENCKMTHADVADVTKISINFLKALEECDFDQLPQPVFVLAYLRKLCDLYNISEAEEELIVKPWMDIQCEIPENLPSFVYADHDNDNRHMIRRLEIGIFTGGAIAVAALVIFGIILLVSHFNSKESVKPAFDETKLLELQPAPVLSVPAVD